MIYPDALARLQSVLCSPFHALDSMVNGGYKLEILSNPAITKFAFKGNQTLNIILNKIYDI